MLRKVTGMDLLCDRRDLEDKVGQESREPWTDSRPSLPGSVAWIDECKFVSLFLSLISIYVIKRGIFLRL